MAGKWVGKAFANAHGQLHKALGIPSGQKIPEGKLEAAANKPGITGKRARLALTARGFNHGGK